jgi:hypothetical protein
VKEAIASISTQSNITNVAPLSNEQISLEEGNNISQFELNYLI